MTRLCWRVVAEFENISRHPNSAKKKIKVVCRYQQYEGANAIVERVIEGKIIKKA